MKSRGRIYIRTLGCPKNEADGAALERHLERSGWVIVNDPEMADTEIINTCGFIEPTKIESLGAIWEGVARKEAASDDKRRLIVTGCLAQRYGQELASEIGSVDAFVGFNRPDLVERALEANKIGNLPVCWIDRPGATYREHTAQWAFDKIHPAPLSAYIKVGDGCDNACRFCAIPQIRGRLRSRSSDAIIEEIRSLTAHGTREVVLVSQDTTSWGLDLKNGVGLASLLHQINDIPGDFWIRIMYAHPAFLTDQQIDTLGECEKIVPYLDMPMQHISDRMLKMMNRHTTRAETQSRIDRLRKVRPDLALRTTFILGHPGETETDFAELLAFAEDNSFERLGSFIYSAEEGTPSAQMDETVPVEISRDRVARLTESFDRWSAQQSADKVGSRLECLIERIADTGDWEGRTVYDAPEIDGRILLSAGSVSAPGLYVVTIDGAEGVDLFGSIGGSAVSVTSEPVVAGRPVA